MSMLLIPLYNEELSFVSLKYSLDVHFDLFRTALTVTMLLNLIKGGFPHVKMIVLVSLARVVFVVGYAAAV